MRFLLTDTNADKTFSPIFAFRQRAISDLKHFFELTAVHTVMKEVFTLHQPSVALNVFLRVDSDGRLAPSVRLFKHVCTY